MVVRRTLALALVVGVIALAIGSLVAVATFPSSEELQRESLERLGLDPDILDLPLVRLIIDQLGGGVEDHVVSEARRSAFLGAIAGGIVVAAGFGLVAADARRREQRAAVARTAPVDPPAAPPVPPPPGAPAPPT